MHAGANYDADVIEFIELIDYTLSNNFMYKWEHRYSRSFISKFQQKVLDTLRSNRTLKVSTLAIFLTKKCKYNKDQVVDFLEAIEIDLYRPFITGDLSKVEL